MELNNYRSMYNKLFQINKIFLVIIFLFFSCLFILPALQAKNINPKACLKCHDDFDLKIFNTSKHADLGCTGCHSEVKGIPHKEELKPVRCAKCHKKAAREYEQSIHAEGRKQGIKEVPYCSDCHGSHDIHANSEELSHVFPTHIPATCGSAKCHSNPKLAKKYGIPISNPLSHYNKSIHAKKLASGDTDAATCVNCHGGHKVLPMADPRSPVNKKNVPETCSQCHDKEYELYEKSIHWTSYKRGVKNAPVCTDCHLEHEVLSPKDPKSTVSHEKVPKLCTDCHSNTQITKRYNIPVRTLKSYLKSYHGLALKSGNFEAADCTSCHSAHYILKSDNPESTVNTKNLKKTCSACHPGIEIDLKNAKIHTMTDKEALFGTKIVFIVRQVYILIIIVSVGSMFLFCMLDLIAKTKRKNKGDHGYEPLSPEPPKHFMRFNKVERMMHLVLLVTFLILVYTGFSRSYPDAFFAAPLTKFMPHIVRDWLHRIAGVIITLDILVQIVCFFTTKRGREQFKELLPKPHDLRDASQMIRYNLGTTKEYPKVRRFSFIEKFEYWALMWGSFLMAFTGVALWFKEVTLSIFPFWVIDLCSTLHFFEAILASLAILIWHFYWVMFNPDIYPLDTKFITGMISEEHMKHEHYAEWEELNKSGIPLEHAKTVEESIERVKMRTKPKSNSRSKKK